MFTKMVEGNQSLPQILNIKSTAFMLNETFLGAIQ